MTRVSGTTVVRAPCCAAIFSVTRYSSINLHAWEIWTDGYHHGAFLDPRDDICRCTCGHYFVPAEYDVLYHRSSTQVEPEYLSVPTMSWVSSLTDLHVCLLSDRATVPVKKVARRRYWRHLNEPFRDHYRACMMLGRVQDITFEPNGEHLENLHALLVLVQADPNPDWLELSELHHELGHAEQALACLERVEESGQKQAANMRAKFESGFRGPFRHWVQPDPTPEAKRRSEKAFERLFASLQPPWWRRLWPGRALGQKPK